jgi:zinc/manganese transport system ATP-binding protein
VNAVELRDVTVALGGREVLSGVSFAIAQGEFVGVLGPNGAGKTTLMRAILGLLRPRHGEIRVLGRPASRGDGAIGYMPQTRGAAPRLAGRDVVAIAAGGRRPGLLPSAADREEARRVIALVGAEPLAGRAVGELSGGERQRLLLAQALLGRPRLLLLDEPLISLDPRHQQEVVDLVRRVQRELGVAVLFSAHELNPLRAALDRVLYLGAGHAALGSVEEVFTGPVLSRLYGAEIEVVRAGGRVFVLSAGHDVERDAHRHEHNGHEHDRHEH